MNTLSNYYGNGYWWLRSPECGDSMFVGRVDPDGYLNSNKVGTEYGVVPALRIRL